MIVIFPFRDKEIIETIFQSPFVVLINILILLHRARGSRVGVMAPFRRMITSIFSFIGRAGYDYIYSYIHGYGG